MKKALVLENLVVLELEQKFDMRSTKGIAQPPRNVTDFDDRVLASHPTKHNVLNLFLEVK
jgi:hypothetical protein